MLIACIVCACNDRLDIIQDYGYSIETLPLPKTMKQGDTLDLEFSIVREGNYSATQYKFRYFQSDGKGLLTYSGRIIPVNRFQNIASDSFVLTYTCQCSEQQQLDFVFENNFGRKVEYTVTFSGGQTDEKTE
jgi:hypothetical protein